MTGGDGGLSPAELDLLVGVAERAVWLAAEDRVVWRPDPGDYPEPLRRPGATFVTLRRRGLLRGCIGTLVASDPLVVAVADHARAAAFEDPRFPAVSPDELPDLDVSVSVLSRPEPFPVRSWAELAGRVRPGVDGLVVEATHHRATFLPAVWEELPEPAEFLDALWRKAGLPARAWPAGIAISRYTAQHAPAGA